METNATSAVPQITTQAAPPPAKPDGRVSADAAATRTDPRPDVPLPIPADASQSGLVTRAALSEKDASPKLAASSVTSAERTLKPYGISMLPQQLDQTEDAADERESVAEFTDGQDGATARDENDALGVQTAPALPASDQAEMSNASADNSVAVSSRDDEAEQPNT